MIPLIPSLIGMPPAGSGKWRMAPISFYLGNSSRTTDLTLVGTLTVGQ